MPTRARRSPAGLSLLALFAFGAATLVLLVAMRGYEAAATGASHHQLDISSLKAAREKQRHEWSAVSASVPTAPYAPPPPPIPAVASFYSERGCKGEGTDVRVDQLGGRTAFSWCDKGPHKLPSGKTFEGNVKSVRVSGTAELELLERCGEESTYWAHVVPSDGCTPIYAWPSTRGSVLRARVSPGLAARQSPVAWPPNLDAPSAARAWADGVRAEGKTPYRVVFSAESSTYQTTQTRCNRLAFERSGQHADGGRWTRLLTMNSADDVSTPFPTFWAPRHPYSRRYGPLNKPDVIVKWYASASAPVAGTDDVIVVIDPDNWLARSLQPWVAQVSVGHAVGQAAWFASAKRQVQSLWKIFCHNRCDEALDELDLVGVPYFVAREDLEKIAPLWRDYSIEMKDKADDDKAFAKRFQGLQIAWSTEMCVYVLSTRATFCLRVCALVAPSVSHGAHPPPPPTRAHSTIRQVWLRLRSSGARHST